MRSLFLNNYKVKIVAVFLATLVWWVINSQHQPRTRDEISVPISCEKLDPRYRCKVDPNEMAITVQGSAAELKQIDTSSIQARIDLRGKGAGEYRLPIKIYNRTGLTIASRRLYAQVTVRELGSMKMPVRVIFESDLPQGSFRTVSDPAQVTVSGDRKRLDRVSHVTARIFDKATGKSLSRNARLIVTDRNGDSVTGVRIVPETVAVTITLMEKVDKPVPVKPDVTGGEMPNVAFDVFPQTVTLTGAPDDLATIDSVSTEKYAIEKCPASGVAEVALRVPQGVTPSSSRVTITCRTNTPANDSKQQKNALDVPVTILNLCRDCRLESVTPQSVRIKITSDTQGDLTADDFTAIIDALQLSPGVHTVKPVVKSLTSSGGNIRIDFSPQQIRLVIDSK